jgi:hypothetical protein
VHPGGQEVAVMAARVFWITEDGVSNGGASELHSGAFYDWKGWPVVRGTDPVFTGCERNLSVTWTESSVNDPRTRRASDP